MTRTTLQSIKEPINQMQASIICQQNVIEQEGTYLLPEARMDRFLLHVMVTYPDMESEAKVLRLVRGEENVCVFDCIDQKSLLLSKLETGRFL